MTKGGGSAFGFQRQGVMPLTDGNEGEGEEDAQVQIGRNAVALEVLELFLAQVLQRGNPAALAGLLEGIEHLVAELGFSPAYAFGHGQVEPAREVAHDAVDAGITALEARGIADAHVDAVLVAVEGEGQAVDDTGARTGEHVEGDAVTLAGDDFVVGELGQLGAAQKKARDGGLLHSGILVGVKGEEGAA